MLKLVLLLIIFFTTLFADNKLTKVKLQLQWKFQYEFAGFIMAKEKGFYEELGIDVDFIEFEPGMNLVKEVIDGNKEFGIWNSSIISEFLNGQDIVILANYFKRSPLALITRPEIKIPSDLIGKTIMVHEYDANSANYQQMFNMFDIKRESINIIDPDFKKVDFDGIDAISIFLTNETYNFIKNSTPYNILDPSNYGVEFSDINLFTSDAFSKQNPKLVNDFIKASTRGWKYAIDNINETVDILYSKYNSQNKTKDALLFEAIESQKFILSKYYELGKVEEDKLNKMAKLYIELGLADKQRNISSMIYPNNISNSLLTIEELKFIKDNPEIIIGSDNSYAPLDFLLNGESTGYSVDLIKMILEEYGFKLKFKPYDKWHNAVNDFLKNEVNILTSVFQSNKYEKKANTSIPYLSAQDIILVRKGYNEITNAYDLSGKTIALPKDYSYLDFLIENGIEFNHLIVENMQEAVNAVASGKADATVESDIVIDYIIDKNGYINLKKIYTIFNPKVDKYHNFIFVVNKDKPILNSLINKGIKNLSVSKRRDLASKWLYNNLNVVEKINLSETEKEFISKKPVITVSNEIDYPPFDFTLDNQAVGYSIDMLKLISNKTGLEFEFINGYKWNELLEMFKDRKIDILHTLSKTSERSKLGIYSKPYVWFRSKFITRIDNPDINDIDDLENKIVAVGKNWSIEKYLYKNHPKIKLLVLDSLESILSAVSNGEADAAIIDDLTAKYSIKKYGYYNLKISSWFRKFNNNQPSSYHFLVQENMSVLSDILNKAIESISVKELNDLEKKWFGNRQSELDFLYLTSEEKEYLNNKKVINMCVDPNWMPLESINNGKHQGISADIINLIKDKTGLNIQLKPTKNWTESLIKIEQRECDIVSLIMKTESRSKYLNFTKPYLRYPFVIATLNSEMYIDKIDSIIDKKIALVRNYAISDILKVRFPNKEFIEVESIQEGLELLKKGEAYAFIDTLVSVAYNIQKYNYVDIKISGKSDLVWDLSIGTRNDEVFLKSIMQKALNLITQKEIQDAYNQWFHVKFEQSVDYSSLIKYLLIVVVIIFVSVFMINKLYNEKRKTQKALNNLKELQKELELKNEELEKISITDKLTNIYNRHKIDEVLKYELLRFARTKQSFGLIIVDVDYFKSVNDEFGHNVGDNVLVSIVDVIRNNIRQTDILGRWGGEEFVIIVTETTKEDIVYFSQKLRKIIESTPIEDIGFKTCSFGVTISKNGDNSNKIIERADSALYLAKQKGRNKVEFID